MTWTNLVKDKVQKFYKYKEATQNRIAKVKIL